MGIRKYELKSGEVRYQANFWKDNQRIETKVFKRKIDAELFLRKLEQNYVESGVGKYIGLNMTYGNFFRDVYCERKSVTIGTFKDYESAYRKHVLPVMKDIQLKNLSSNDWSGLLANLQVAGMSSPRLNRVHTSISAVYCMAVELNYVASNPMSVIGWKREPITKLDFLSHQEVQRFLGYCIANTLPLATLYQTSYETGLRIGEVLGLKRDCVDLNSNTILICRTYSTSTRSVVPTTKSGHERVLGLNPGLKKALIQLMSQHSSDYIFCDNNGKHLLYESVRKYFRRDQEDAGVRSVNLHVLRHTFASHYVMNGGSIYELKDLMGHASVDTTQRYAHLAKDHLKSKAALVSFESTTAELVPRKSRALPETEAALEGTSCHPTLRNLIIF